MKTKVWIALLAGLFVLCALSAFLLLAPGREAVTAEILSDGTAALPRSSRDPWRIAPPIAVTPLGRMRA
jgi:hypothetical protein